MQALHFHECENLILTGLTHINSPRNHISLNACHGSHISELHIIAPDDSPNTDGIDIAESSNVIIQNSKIETGNSQTSSYICYTPTSFLKIINNLVYPLNCIFPR